MDELLSKAYRIKDEAFGDKPGYMRPRDIHPHMRAWIVSLILTIWGIIIVDTWFSAVLIGCIWLVTQWAFFRAKVLL